MPLLEKKTKSSIIVAYGVSLPSMQQNNIGKSFDHDIAYYSSAPYHYCTYRFIVFPPHFIVMNSSVENYTPIDHARRPKQTHRPKKITGFQLDTKSIADKRFYTRCNYCFAVDEPFCYIHIKAFRDHMITNHVGIPYNQAFLYKIAAAKRIKQEAALSNEFEQEDDCVDTSDIRVDFDEASQERSSLSKEEEESSEKEEVASNKEEKEASKPAPNKNLAPELSFAPTFIPPPFYALASHSPYCPAKNPPSIQSMRHRIAAKIKNKQDKIGEFTAANLHENEEFDENDKMTKEGDVDQ